MQGVGRGTKAKRKSKAAVPKPPRGSGLNPSGQPSSGQLNIASEQLQMPDHMFDPYSDGSGGWPRTFLDDNTTPQFNIDEDGNFDIEALYGRTSGQMLPPQASGSSLPRSVRDTSDGGVQLVPAFKPTNPTLMRRGEIPAGDVVHTIGPARTVLPSTGDAQRPAVETETPTAADTRTMTPSSSVSPPMVTLTEEVRNQILGDAKRDIVGSLFMENAMSQTSAERKNIIKAVIMSACPRFSALTVSLNAIINKEQMRSLSQTLSNARGKIIDMARSGVPFAYDLYRPRHMQGRAPLAYRVHIATTLTESPTLAFMHTYHFNEHGVLQIDSTFNNPFIKHIVIRFIWYNGYERFLGNSPLQSLINVHALAGAATHCVLLEQRMDKPSVDPFTGLVHYNKFIEIRNTLCSLVGEEKISFEAYLRDILDVGPSQMRSVTKDDDL
ncbi:hypothetical protein P692DRAFT_20870647 [Suillus brevipes Sb2]|nr:hypothetical protein P692DRAFT_20870647 [Suillus brevipes Sb2]